MTKQLEQEEKMKVNLWEYIIRMINKKQATGNEVVFKAKGPKRFI